MTPADEGGAEGALPDDRGVIVAPPAAGDRAEWRRLYDAYALFYKREMTDAIADRVWGWISDPRPHGPCEGRIARTEDGRVVGLAHFRDMASPLRGTVCGFLDDLFVDPAWRGRPAGSGIVPSGSSIAPAGGSIARLLLDDIAAIGRARGWPFYRWLTADDNYRARTLYDRVATRTMWVTYQYDL